jgi:hypothetical protein
LLPQIGFQAKVTILANCLSICQGQPPLIFKKACNFKLLHLASELPPIPMGEGTAMDKNLIVKPKVDIDPLDKLPEEDKDFLKSLEKMAAEIESEGDNSKKG